VAVAGAIIVAWPFQQVSSQEVANPDREKAAQPKPAADSEKRAQSDEPGNAATWLQAQDMSGSSPQSEQAVDLALAWLAEHQLANGGWSFDHRLGACRGRCSNPGRVAAGAVNGATGLGLLPFIDHGNTHQSGAYRQNVAAGLQFLMARMANDGSLWELGGTMYSHALGLWAMCEDLRIEKETPGLGAEFTSPSSAATEKKTTRPTVNHAATTANSKTGRPTAQQLKERKQRKQRELLDQRIAAAASKALAYALACQDSRGGGWRYLPGSSDSDITVTGWHVLALHSATAINLPIPTRTSLGVTSHLNSLQGNYGAAYGYRHSAIEATPLRSAVGLLCRDYTGWNRQQLQRGVEILATLGPSEFDMYYNFYATLLLHDYGGPLWDNWNRKLRDYLIRTQSRLGHETGSWSFRASKSNLMGGRHFDTCLACLLLESSYSSKPAYASTQPAKAKPAKPAPDRTGDAPAKPE
jgi:hypothetical protein